MTESEIREELASIASRFGGHVTPADVPAEIVRDYSHGLATGMWLLKIPNNRDHRLVVRAIAGINAAIESRGIRELDEAGRVLLTAVMQAMGNQFEQPHRIMILRSGDEVRITLIADYGASSNIGAFRLESHSVAA